MKLEIKLLLILFISIGLISAFYFSSFSYWWDELYSVSATTLPMLDMFKDFIFKDVHPPLYQVFLYFWAGLFGVGESTTRFLSTLFYFLTCVYVYRIAKFQQLNMLSILAIFFHPLLLFYAFEARSYSLLAFFSVSTYFYYIKTQKARFIYYFATSLTHYFGLFYVGVLLIKEFFLSILKDKKDLFYIINISFLCLLWPIIHYIFGDISGKTGGNFWIKSEGILDTLSKYTYAVFPYLEGVYRLLGVHLYGTYINLLGIILFIFIAQKNAYNHELIKLILAFILIVALIDLISPISTSRNFIVLVPLTYLIILNIINKYKFITIFLILLNAYYSYVLLEYKSSPMQNPREAYTYINETKNKIICITDKRDLVSMTPLIYNFYNNSENKLICLDKLTVFSNIENYQVLISMHNKLDENDVKFLIENNFKIETFNEHRKNSTILAIKQ